MELRPYQLEAVNAVWDHLQKRDDNPCVVIPTGGGKTPVMATLCREATKPGWDGRVLILAHVKELLEQSVDKLQKLCPGVQVGVFSAGLGRREKRGQVIVAGIQSVYSKACDLEAFDLILVDEAHLIPPSGEGMYQTFLNQARVVNPNVRVIGLTATPYRMGTGLICHPGNILNHVCYEVGVKELIVKGFLCPVRSKAGKKKADLSELHIRGGEWIDSELQSAMMDEQVLGASCSEILEHTGDRKSVLIFCCGIDHANAVASRLPGAACVFGHTLNRAEILDDFKAGRLKYLCNMNVLTTGFDAPNIDCVAMLRPTLSPGLYYQMVGRGFRLCEGKADCLVLDFGQNIVRHGPVDCIRPDPAKRGGAGGEGPAKECPNCHAVIAAGYGQCPECQHNFDKAEKEAKHTSEASEQAVISEEVTVTECDVQDVKYRVHTKKDAPPDAPRTLRVDYSCGLKARVSEWICLEHDGFVHEKAARWWKERSFAPVPKTIDEAVELAHSLATPLKIKIRHVKGEKFERIIGYEMGPIPEFAITIPEPPPPVEDKGDAWEPTEKQTSSEDWWQNGKCHWPEDAPF